MEGADLRRLEPTMIPMALARIHRAVSPGDRRVLRLPATLDEARRRDLLEGAGFAAVRGISAVNTTVERLLSLPDTVAGGMRLLVCGLNPSPAAADAGVGFARPGNRFWPAALAAGLVSVDRDPDHALEQHGVGMTDLVKRTTRRADQLEASEYIAGLERVERLVDWLEPGAVCFVGLAGWRAAVDRRARPGRQERELGGRPVHVIPSTSGLNAGSSLDDLTRHLARAAR